ncbi:Spo0B C-terminal domain-containing protein [Metabacillus herbersteinensis]|uniref:Spo0B C-terminal domain-containing protein n=1 Tax=Metabacillus herbersteinensis TaxID=283816 RepID=A0ABV6G8Z8_9BACI
MKRNHNEWGTVDLLSHSRHDWMNKLQLIKGNLSLNKYERVNEIIEEIVIEAQNESKLCNLKMLSFASLLMTYNWIQAHFTLEYEVLGDVVDLSSFDEFMTKWCSSFFYLLNETIDRSRENHLCISIETVPSSDEVRFFFDFNGIITEKEQLQVWLESENAQKFLKQYEISTYELTAMIAIKK